MPENIASYEIISVPLHIHDHLGHSEQLGMCCQLIHRHGQLIALDLHAIPVIIATCVFVFQYLNYKLFSAL